MEQAGAEGPGATATEAGQAVRTAQAGQLGMELAGRLRQRHGSDTQWLDAVRRVPRHLFLPDRAWRLHEAQLVPIDRTTDPQGWMEAAHSDDSIVTQLDGNNPTSSCSMPYMVVQMLDLLDPQPGHRVLEIGTGTGWNAALLADRLGRDSVFTIEVDPQVAQQAERNLNAADASVSVVTGDGVAGYPARAPYDRIIATCAVHQVPHQWVQQTVDGGVIVIPWDSPLGLGGLLRLTVADDTGSGKFVSPSLFMWLRGQQPQMPEEPEDFCQRAATSRATIEVEKIRDNLARFVLGLLVPGCQPGGYWSAPEIWLFATDAWASVEAATGTVRQLGSRRLWDEVESAYRWWIAQGEPDLTRFGLTVTPDRQWVWLDDPDQEVSLTW